MTARPELNSRCCSRSRKADIFKHLNNHRQCFNRDVGAARLRAIGGVQDCKILILRHDV